MVSRLLCRRTRGIASPQWLNRDAVDLTSLFYVTYQAETRVDASMPKLFRITFGLALFGGVRLL